MCLLWAVAYGTVTRLCPLMPLIIILPRVSPLDLDLASLLSGRFFITSCGFQLRFGMYMYVAVFFIFVVDRTITVGSDRYYMYNPSLALLCHHSFSVGQS